MTTLLRKYNIDIEKVMIMIGLTFMETFGAIMFICTFFDIRIVQVLNIDENPWKPLENTIF